MKMITQFLLIVDDIEVEVNVDASSGVVICVEVSVDYVTPREVAWREERLHGERREVLVHIASILHTLFFFKKLFLSDPGPIIVYPSQSLTHWLTD